MFHLLILFKHLWYSLFSYFQEDTFYHKKAKETEEVFIPYSHPNKKPSWVKNKVMYLKMHQVTYGCRKIAMDFNRQYAHKNISVSKSYVYRVLKEHGYEVLKFTAFERNKLPYKKIKNQMWHMDLTTIDQMQIFGVIDSGTRALLVLKHLPTKSTVNILITILEAIRDYGKPQSIKSDNEMVFTSKLMRFVLWLLDIKRETTEIASPWQNGKIERLFGTMKQGFTDLIFPTVQSLEDRLKEFRFFYNHVRMHQNLNYTTPANAWSGNAMSTSKTAREIVYYQGLCDNVAGFYFRE